LCAPVAAYWTSTGPANTTLPPGSTARADTDASTRSSAAGWYTGRSTEATEPPFGAIRLTRSRGVKYHPPVTRMLPSASTSMS
jgi:hypothetical protein